MKGRIEMTQVRQDLLKYLQYVENAKVATIENFDEDWEPVGPMVRGELMPALIAVSETGALHLTEAGRAAIQPQT